MKQRRKARFIKLLAVVFWLLLWQLCYRLVGSDLLLASPLSVIQRLAAMCISASFWQILAHSLWRILAGLLIGAVVGGILGLLSGYSKAARSFIGIPMGMIKATPVASFVILALIWISGKNLSIFICFLVVTPVVWSSVSQGVQSVDPLLKEAAGILRLNRWDRFRVLILPSVKPYFLSALRVCIGFAWKAGVAGEVIAIPKSAIGTQLYNAKIYLETTDLFAWTAVVILLSVLVEKLITKLIEVYGGKETKQ